MSYIIGIDVGGTNTNAVLLHKYRNRYGNACAHVISTAKTATDHDNLLSGAGSVFKDIFRYLPANVGNDLEIHLSTTLITNSVIEGRGDPVITIVSTGPGMRLDDLNFSFPVIPVKGAIDHRGRETTPLDNNQILDALRKGKKAGGRGVAVIGKFSPRNPEHELKIEELIKKHFPEYLPATLGHRLSGRLNFPRRVTTSYLNATVARLQNEFSTRACEIIEKTLAEEGIKKSVHKHSGVCLLKADGGTIGLRESIKRPVETILSGPAASVMGTLALARVQSKESNIVVLDIGGTTTDISLIIDGKPLIEKDGAVVGGFKTVVPALFSRSYGLGGDSSVRFIDGVPRIGPDRAGRPVALGGNFVTPTDAIMVADGLSFGNRYKSLAALKSIGEPFGYSAEKTAQYINNAFCRQAVEAINEIFTCVNSLSLYTVSEVLAFREGSERVVKPDKIIGMGGPAGYYIPMIAELLNLSYEVLPYYESANAIGAAASLPTAAINFRADTALGRVIVPELDRISEISRPVLFDPKKAKTLAFDYLEEFARNVNGSWDESRGCAEFEVIEEEIFNVVRGFHRIGKIFSITVQVKPEAIRVKS